MGERNKVKHTPLPAHWAKMEKMTLVARRYLLAEELKSER
jgi:hypothetical protein